MGVLPIPWDLSYKLLQRIHIFWPTSLFKFRKVLATSLIHSDYKFTNNFWFYNANEICYNSKHFSFRVLTTPLVLAYTMSFSNIDIKKTHSNVWTSITWYFFLHYRLSYVARFVSSLSYAIFYVIFFHLHLWKS